METEGILDHQGRAGIMSIVRWNLRPVIIFGVDQFLSPPSFVPLEGFLFSSDWEVLNGVGVDGVGGIFPFFTFFFVFFRFSSFFFAFLRFSSLFFVFLLEDKGEQLQFTAKMGNFTPTPSAPTPCATSQSDASWGEESEKHRLEDTIWNPYGKLAAMCRRFAIWSCDLPLSEVIH